MTNLSAKEQDLLQRIDNKEELRPLFFHKVKGLKWFIPLAERGYFNPEENPKPVAAKEEGYINVPSWPAITYLVKTASELSDDKNTEYAQKFLQVLVNVTNYAKESSISNYRTWWQFAEIISQIPHSEITIEHVDLVDYWLDDKFERGIVIAVIGEKWLPSLLNLDDIHTLQLAKRLLGILYKIIFTEHVSGGSSREVASFRFDYYHAEKITEKVATLAGEKLGIDAVDEFDSHLKSILNRSENDLWSSIWQPAIENHEQNKYHDDAVNILINAYRDSLTGYISIKPDESGIYIKKMLDSEYQTIHRIAIYVISNHYHLFSEIIDRLLDQKYLESNYRHEMWHLLNRNYRLFPLPQKEKILEIIAAMSREDDSGNFHAGGSAYDKAIWLSAIKDYGVQEEQLYKQNIKIAKTEPENSDFSSFMTVDWKGRESPISLEHLQSLSIDELTQELEEYKDHKRFNDSGLEGLVATFKQLIKTEPLKFYLDLGKLTKLEPAYIHEVIEAYRSLWSEEVSLPWDDIWSKILEFCSTVVEQEQFWISETVSQGAPFVGNRHWIVTSIGRLIEAGTKSDEHAFGEEHLKSAEELLLYLLERQGGEEFKVDSDAVSISINSPRGHCLAALINLTLRSCRIADKKHNKDHSNIWAYFQNFYNSELDRADAEKPDYEFATLVTNYLPNFIYMSKEWVFENLNRIFDQSNYQKWLCAIQGYAYVGTVDRNVYKHLKNNGDFLKVLADENVNEPVEKKVIQNIAIAYLYDFDALKEDDSLINSLITRNKYNQISHLIWFIWTLRNKSDDKLKNKVYDLWPKILLNIDFSTRDGKRLASQLCHWVTFVEQIDDERREILLEIAPYSDESHNSSELLENIARISRTQPDEAYVIWIRMLESSTPDYPEEAIREIFTNLLISGDEGLRKAREIESEYIKSGNDRPSLWLRDIRQEKINE